MQRSKESSELGFQFFVSQFQIERSIKNDEGKSKVDLVLYYPIERNCVLKQYYQKDLISIYKQLEQIHHPNLPVIYKAVYYKGDTYVLEEYIDGKSLRELLMERIKESEEGVDYFFTEEEVVSIINQLCQALSMLHDQNPPLIHRDIKPENIMVKPDNSIKLIDFDIARVYQVEKDNDTRVMGTREYAAPEQFGYGQTSEKSDIYSIGVLMHELLTGSLSIKNGVAYEGKLKPIIETCIQIDPKRRYQTVKELQIDLKRALNGERITVSNILQQEQHRSKSNRSEWIKIAILLLCIGIAGSFYYSVLLDRNKKAVESENEQKEEIPDVWLSYKNGESPRKLLKNAVIQEKLENLLGVKYDYFMNGIDEVKIPDYNTKEDYYYVEGHVAELKGVIGSALVIYRDGTIVCSFVQDDKNYYYSETKEGYEQPPIELIEWMISNGDYPIIFKEKGEQLSFDLSGNYIREDGYLKLQKNEDETYSLLGANGDSTFGILRETKGVVKKVSDYSWTYIQEWGGVTLELYSFYDFIYVTTLMDDAQDAEEMQFDGLYKRT
ncbi:MAG TPA: hypothetical protein DIT54_02665 [Lachnospiraceae bacterium]|nr:hypothetical protein [Lachnospiraceae bacterium]HIS63607.1 serine/threonine protein kinase [Candidatus Scybalomonas excrementigallinarum]